MWRPLTGSLLLAAILCCTQQPVRGEEATEPQAKQQERKAERRRMVREQIARRGVVDAHVLKAMEQVPRHRFVPARQAARAYNDYPLAIGHKQTISQPYIVALMSELLKVKPGHKVLEVGTGSGYQAAVLDAMGLQVFSIEIVKPLADGARQRLRQLGYSRVHVRHADGYAGWPSQAPFDGIIITAAPPRIPEPLKQQLKVGGRMVVPVGRGQQQLMVLTRTAQGFTRRSALPVRFVPMTGKAQQPR